MHLKKKILLGYGVAFALMGLVVASAVVNLVSLGRASDAILQENYRSILAAENMVDALEHQDSATLLILFEDAQKGMAQFRKNEEAFFQWLGRAKDNITISGEEKLVQSIDDSYGKYLTVFSRLANPQQGISPGNLKGMDLYHRDIYPSFSKVIDACIRLRNLNEETMYAASIHAGRVAQRAIWSTVAVAAAAFLIALLFSLLLSERLVRPLHRFMSASRQIAGGDYTVQVPVETADELGLLAQEFNQMASKLAHYNQMNIGKIIAEKQKGEAILTSIEDGLVVLDTGLRVTDVNPAARHMLGLNFDSYLSRHCRDILPDRRICDLIQEAAEGAVLPAEEEDSRFLTLAFGEKTRHYHFSITSIQTEEGQISGVVLLLRDVTRLKEVERLKSEFVMAASHELRTPLTGMEMSIDLLIEHTANKLPPRDQELLQAAHEEVQRLKALVNDLLDLSKIEAGRIELEFERTALELLFERVEAVFKGQLEKKSVEIIAKVPEGLPEVRADANKITWVLTNLVSNALRYVPRGGGHIWISAKRVGSHVHVSVQDDGPGISPEYQSRIFHKFVQVKGQETGGTGLGLAICKEIIRAHGGAIWLESTPGEGSTFTFTLPVAA
jgi:NtrC-family two-component system sensor histidine kinase KinB